MDADGRKLSKSLQALPVDDDDPLPALRFAWAALGQPAAPLVGCGRVDAFLDAARASFDPTLIPADSIALHNAGVAIAS